MPSRSGLLLGLALATLLVSCGDGRTPLVIYSPHGRDLLALLEARFEELHPQVDVRWLDMGSQEVYDRVRSEASNPQCDVWFGGPDTIFSRGAANDLFEPFRPTWATQLPAESRHPEDLYFGVYLAVPILFYNSAALSPEEAPSDWEDLLDERFAGEVVIRDPLASGTMRTAFGMVLAKSVAETGGPERGFDWLRRLDAQTSDYVSNPALLFEKIMRQEGLVTIWELTDALLLQQRKAPVGYAFPSSGTPVIDDSIGLVKGARNAAAAREFIEWVGGEEALLLTVRNVFRLPARLDMPAEELPEWAQAALSEIVRADVDTDLIARHGKEWMTRWDREVRGKGDASR